MKIDILGEPYESIEIPLPDDEQGPVVATLVRRNTRRWLNKAVLYVHGYSDYFFQKEMAEKYIEHGYRFYALDLRKYGRSLLPHQTQCFCKNIEEYFPEIDKAIEIIQEDKNEKIILNGHSTGGLVASLYAHHVRQKNPFQAIFLNSPFFEFNENFLARKVLIELISALGEKHPYRKIPAGISENYGHSLHQDFKGEWLFNINWKPIRGIPLRAGWLRAILEAHKLIKLGLDIPCPILVMHSDKSSWVDEWDDIVLESDAILNVEHISRNTELLGDHITRIRIKNAMHDLVLSRSEIREEVYKHLFRWLKIYG